MLGDFKPIYTLNNKSFEKNNAFTNSIYLFIYFTWKPQFLIFCTDIVFVMK